LHSKHFAPRDALAAPPLYGRSALKRA